jgi:hypothetical protein
VFARHSGGQRNEDGGRSASRFRLARVGVNLVIMFQLFSPYGLLYPSLLGRSIEGQARHYDEYGNQNQSGYDQSGGLFQAPQLCC